jgi:hypothetical protein
MVKVFLLIFLSFELIANHHEIENFQDTFQTLIVSDKTILIGDNLNEICSKSSKKYITEGSTIILVDVHDCRTYSGLKYYFELFFNGKAYYVEKDDIKKSEYYKTNLSLMNNIEKETLKLQALKLSSKMHSIDSQRIHKFLTVTKNKGLVLVNYEIYEMSSYTEGTGFKFKIYNPTNKVIKYVYFSIIGYNAVNDPIYDKINKKTNISVKGVGPIKQGESSDYEFEYVWSTDLVEKVKIKEIKIQYMDGSIKIIKNVNDIIISEYDYFILMNNYYK